MAKDKDRSINPAAAQRKAEKQKALKKGKAVVTAQRNERLAHRNPDRLQVQIDELRAKQEQHGQLAQREQALLAGLERDVSQIRKAKAAVGETPATNETTKGRDWKRPDGAQVLGKRARLHDERRRRSLSSETDDDVRDIPMPRDTPPPVPRKFDGRQRREKDRPVIDANQPRTVIPAQIVYEAKPAIRNLRKEAVGFVPNVVKRKLDVVKGGLQQPLLEEEDLERLEEEGYRLQAQRSTMSEQAAENQGSPIVNEANGNSDRSKQARVENGDEER